MIQGSGDHLPGGSASFRALAPRVERQLDRVGHDERGTDEQERADHGGQGAKIHNEVRERAED